MGYLISKSVTIALLIHINNRSTTPEAFFFFFKYKKAPFRNNELKNFLRLEYLSFLFLMPVRKGPMIARGLALGGRVPSDALDDTLAPPSFQVERLKVFELWVRFSFLIIRHRRSVSVIR